MRNTTTRSTRKETRRTPRVERARRDTGRRQGDGALAVLSRRDASEPCANAHRGGERPLQWGTSAREEARGGRSEEGVASNQ